MDSIVPVIQGIITAIATVCAAIISRDKRPGIGDATTTVTPPEFSVSFVLGCVSLVAWIIPLAGLPLSVLGIGFGIGDFTNRRTKRLTATGIWMNTVALIASSANAALGAYKSVYGSMPN